MTVPLGGQVLGSGQMFAGRYRIERFLAQGGFGAVYVAEQLATEARVAIKVLWPHVLQARDAVEKFEQEARIAGRVNSDHIVRVLDAGYDDSTHMPFLVMELLDGEDLGQRIEREGALPPEVVVDYLSQTASALDRAHSYVDREGVPRPIVHRDLKPENLFLARRDDGGLTVKVLDFGIAKILNSTSDVSRDVKGTPLFMAFEQASGAAITPRTDVWALGLIAFYLLTGQNYWNTSRQPDAALMQLFAEVLSLPLDPASVRLAGIGHPALLPPGFDAWFGRCVNRETEQRFPSAGEAVAELANVFGIVPAVSRRESLPAAVPASALPVSPQAAPDQTLESASGAAGATDRSLAVAGTIVSARPRRSRVLPIAGAIVVLVLVGGGIALGVLFARRPPVAQAAASEGPAAMGPRNSAPAAIAKAPPSAASSVPIPSASPTHSSSPPTPPKPAVRRHKAVQAAQRAAPPAQHAQPPAQHAQRPAQHVTKPSEDNGVYGER